MSRNMNNPGASATGSLRAALTSFKKKKGENQTAAALESLELNAIIWFIRGVIIKQHYN